jgi:CzcA family heavy metal efflux pump
MFRWLIGSSLEFRVVVLGIAAALIVFGSVQLQKMPMDVFPEYEQPIVKVQTDAIGLSAQEIEDMITLNLEELLSGVPWLDSIRSESVTGLSSIELRFHRGTDLIRARQMVQERLALAIYLPNVAQPPQILQPLSATSRFMMIGISSDTVEPTELSMLARWTIQPKLLGIPGVSNLAIWGQRLRQMHVQIDPARLNDARLIQNDVITAAGDALWVSPLTYLKGSTPGTGGWVDGPEQRLGVQHVMPIRTPEDMAKVAVASQHLLLKGKKMALGEVAEVSFGHPPLIGDAYVNGGKGLLLVVEKFPSANTLEVTRGVEKALAELRLGLPGVMIDASVFKLATYIEDSVSNLTQALIIGGILVILVIGAFVFNWRTALIGLVSIPVSLFAAVIVLDWMGATLNTMILAGLVLALGVVIDDAIVGVDRLMGRLRERTEESGESMTKIIVDTTLETRSATLYAAAIILLAVTPIFFMGGISGAFFQPLALAYGLAVFASLIVGLTVTPALSLLLLGKGQGRMAESPIAVGLRNGYDAMLGAAVKAPRAVAGVAALAVVAGLAVWPLLGQSLLPSLKERELLVNIATAPGTSHQETYRIASRLSEELKSLPQVRNVGAHIGRAVMGDQIVGINSAQIWVGIDPESDYEATVSEIRGTINGYPGIDRNVQAYLRDTVGQALTGASNAVVVRIFGPNREILREKAEEVRNALDGIDGLVDLRAVGQVKEPQIRVKVDLEKAGAANVKPGEVRRASATVFAGLTVGYLYEQQKIYDVLVWSAPEARNSIDNINNLLVEKADRTHVRLGDVADVRIVPTPTVIKHDGSASYIDVVANVSGRDLASVNVDVESRLAQVKFPLEHYPKILGEFLEQKEAQTRTLGLAISALIGIFLLLQACLRSWGLALIGFLAIPAAVAGGVLAAAASGGLMTLGSLVGFFAVVGIASRNGILLISHYQRLEREDGVPFGPDLVLRGARERLSPILASSTAIVAALLPIVALGQIAGLEIVQPTAIVIVGGVVASTLVTLFVIPALYLVVGSGADRQADLDLAGA